MRSHFASGTEDNVHEQLIQAEAWEIASVLYPTQRVSIEAEPTNWDLASREKIDLAAIQTKRWAMVAELKYFSTSEAVEVGRAELAQDLARVAHAEASATTGLRLVILVTHSHGKDWLWPDNAKSRIGNDWLGLNDLVLPERVGGVKSATVSAIEAKALDWQKRTPSSTLLPGTTTVTVTLLSEAEFVQTKQSGVVRVWSVERKP
jgi:hypothetical protein